jgi:hypothetical protein
VFNLLPSADRAELYPGEREDVVDFSLPGHASHLGEGWHELEGSFGNRYRWMGPRAVAHLSPVGPGTWRLRVRGYAHETQFHQGHPVRIELLVNGTRVARKTLERTGLFVVEADLPAAGDYNVEVLASPVWSAPGDGRQFTVNLSMIRLVPGN